MSRKKRKATARTTKAVPPNRQPEKQPPVPWWRRLSKPAAWIAGVATVVVTGVLSTLLVWVGREVVDGPAVKDRIREVTRAKDDVRYTITHENDGWIIALPEGVALTPAQRSFLAKSSYTVPEVDGYTLDRLAGELRAVGGAEVPKQTLRLTVEGHRNQPIRVDSIKPVNIHHQRPYDGTLLLVPPQEGGNTAEMVFNFDDVDPQARIALDDDNGGYKPGEPYFLKKTLTIKDAAQDVVVIRSMTTRSAVSFEIQIDYHIGDEARHIVIDDGGHPFSVSPMRCADRSTLDADGALISQGHASYQKILARSGASGAIDDVRNPGRFELGTPFC
ncbi:hypothetical protein OG767_13390 [Micromonospora sp. NBC_01392]|uniref:hypothetical protein n=1 Tax=Micromonospora sp. NBC_01392 TaxID=2903588 RepID=UPI003256133E